MANKKYNVDRCTFCGKSRKLVDILIAGPPNIYICSECVELCNAILAEGRRKDYDRGGKKGKKLPTPREIRDKLTHM